MRHSKSKNRLNRFTSWRKATILSMARNLVIYQRIRTTKAKAKAVRPVIEKLIHLAKKNTLTAKRAAFKILNDHRLVSTLFSEIGPRFAKRTSGYSRILSLGRRRGDDAELVLFELTEIKKPEAKKAKKSKVSKEPQEGLKADTSGQAKEHTQQEDSGKQKTEIATKEKPPISKQPSKKFLGGLRKIFKKERDSL
ncbi:MAG: 50S ribosomal protein L17 [Candidatus Omnitrophota bacterium]|jgi:large subunit ribosomal protein L17|nr:MAG: 50S ribosomal protein L17 [Candidatus Omnitrophota bacterium]